MGEPNRWDYWRPHEGDHKIHPNELQIGVVSAAGEVLQLVTVVPPMEIRDGDTQAEPFAKAIVDDLAMRSWSDPNGWTSWLFAHGHKMAAREWPPRFDPMTGKHEDRHDG